MLPSKSLFFSLAAFVCSVASAPLESPNPAVILLERANPEAMVCHFPNEGPAYQISKEQVRTTLLHSGGKKKGISNYPHVFDNNEKISFPPSCRENGKDKVVYEFPIYNMEGKYWKRETRRDAQDFLPPFRIVYHVHDKKVGDHVVEEITFCFVMVHKERQPGTEGLHGGKGPFKRCKMA